MNEVDKICAFALEYLNIVVQPHQREWLDHLVNGGDDVILLAPRGHGKTTVLIEVYLVYMICNNPDIKILLASHKEAVARRQARMIQLHLERKKISDDFGITKDSPWRRDEFYIKEHGQPKDAPVIFTVAGEGGMTGYRFDVIIFDDLLVKKNQKTEALRLKLKEWIDDEVMAAGDPGVKTLVIGTRKDFKDWYSELLADDIYSSRVDKAIQDDGSFLWPWLLDADGNRTKRKFDEQELDRRKKKHGPRSFAQEYMNEVAPAEGMLLKREWIKTYEELPPQQFLDIYMGVDPSYGSTKERASSLAIAVIAFDHRRGQEHVYVVELYKEQLTLNKQIDKIVEMADKHQPMSTNIESVLINKHFANHIIDMMPNFYPIDYMHDRLKGTTELDKDARIQNYIGWYFSKGHVSVPDPAYNQDIRDFIETEYIEFPFGEKDQLDALNLAVDLVDLSEGGTELPLYSF